MYFQLIHIDFIIYLFLVLITIPSPQTIVSKGLHTKIRSIIWLERQILLSEVMYSKTHWLEGLLFCGASFTLDSLIHSWCWEAIPSPTPGIEHNFHNV